MIPGRLGRSHVARHSVYEGINIIGQSQDLHVHCNGPFRPSIFPKVPVETIFVALPESPIVPSIIIVIIVVVVVIRATSIGLLFV